MVYIYINGLHMIVKHDVILSEWFGYFCLLDLKLLEAFDEPINQCHWSYNNGAVKISGISTKCFFSWIAC